MRTTLLLSALASAALVIACSAADKRSGFEPAVDPNAVSEGGPSLGEVKEAGPTKCATAQAAAIKPPIDIIIIVDQSGSMSEELSSVKANINTMSTLLDKAGIDYHVVMIGTVGTGTYDICVPPPLGGPNCTSNGTKYRAVNAHVESNDALTIVLSTLDQASGPTAWRDFLRPEAEKIFIPVTDDNALNASYQPLNPNQWDADLLAKGMGGTKPLFGTDTLRKYKFFPIAGAQDFPSEVKCSSAVNNSSVYLELAKMTGGEWFNVCSGAFAPVFTKIGSVLSAQSACEMTIPTPENGGELDPDKVNVKFTSADGKTVTDILQDKTKGCADGANGWQYSEDGTKILLCGTDCETARNDPGSKVDVEFGCATKVK